MAALAACAPSYRVRVYEPGYAGVRTTALEGNVLTSGSLLSSGDMELNLERVDSAGAVPRFALRVSVRTDGLEIARKAPLLLLLGGDTLALAPDTLAQQRSRADEVRVEERRYPIAHGELGRLAAADDVRVRLRVGPWIEERRLYPRNVENVRRFVADHLPADSTAVPPRPRR